MTLLRFLPRDARPFDERAAAALHPYVGVTARLLYARGITDAAQAERYLHPTAEQLHDPMRMHGMAQALDILSRAKAENWETVVYGDYDVDGISACTLLVEALRAYGLHVTPHVPLRAEGYGLNEEAVRTLAKSYRLLVTVDLGITNHDEVRLAQSLGMTVIVTDHHGLSLEESPADAALNPLLGEYPFRRLCGTGVAFKLAQALLGLENCEQWLDLAALATVADVVPLTDENRVLVALGLPKIAQGKRAGLRALLEISGVSGAVDSETLGFRLGPRLNAAGRLGDANDAVRLLLTQDEQEATALAAALDHLNAERKNAEADLVREAMRAAEAHDFIREPALIIKGTDWHVGVIGLAAGRLCQRYGCPVCVLSEHEGVLHGSLRSVPGVHIHHCLQACDAVLMKYGGHELAAGVTLSSEQYPAFCERLQQEIAKADPACFVPAQHYDAELPLSEATDALIDELSLLAPFGCDNPPPLFLSRGLHVEERRTVGAEGAHLKLTLRDEAAVLPAIAFSMGERAAALPEQLDVVFSLSHNTFRGNTTIQMDIKALEGASGAAADAIRRAPREQARAELLLSLMDALEYAGKADVDAECIQVADVSWPRLQTAARGRLLIARTPEVAQRALRLTDVDTVRHAPSDPLLFQTLVLAPLVSRQGGHWREVWLLDGELFAGEAALWHAALPEARIFIGKENSALCALAAEVDAGDEAYRTLYKQLRKQAPRSLSQLAQWAGLSASQAQAGLLAFHALGLVRYTEAPFDCVLLPPAKCELGDAPVLSALRALTAKGGKQP